MDKKSVFFSLHSISSKVPHARRFYYKSNKFDSVNLLNYIIDAHSFDDVGSTPFSLLNIHDQKKIYDTKKGYIDFEKINPVHKHSYIFSGIISFDENLSNADIFKLQWEDISQLVFNTILEYNDFDRNEWDMQSNMHYNTSNKHIQFRFYQNSSTPDNHLYKKYFIPNKCLKLIKQRIYSFVESKQQLPVQNYPHLLKHVAMKGYNNRIRENKNLIQDFLDVIKSKNQNEPKTKKVLVNISEIYFKRTIFSKWLQSISAELNLTKVEEDNIKAMIINNVSDGLYTFIQQNKYAKVFDFVSKPDPNDKSNDQQRFKNYDNINHSCDFVKLTSYSSSLVKKVYKEPISRFIDFVLKSNHCNIPEVETAVSNYLSVIRPEYKQKIEITKVNKVIKQADIKQLLLECIKRYDPKEIDYKIFNPTALEYYKKSWLLNWIKEWCNKNNLSKEVTNQIHQAAIKTILLDIHYNILNIKNKNPKLTDEQVIQQLLLKDRWIPMSLEQNVQEVLTKNNLGELIERFIPINTNKKIIK